ncbi:MAG: hypothetical protein ACSNEK_02960 [Parachlamydiaceae bacterium]
MAIPLSNSQPLYQQCPQKKTLRKMAINLKNAKLFACSLAIKTLAIALLFACCIMLYPVAVKPLLTICCIAALSCAGLAGLAAVVSTLAQKYIENKFK